MIWQGARVPKINEIWMLPRFENLLNISWILIQIKFEKNREKIKSKYDLCFEIHFFEFLLPIQVGPKIAILASFGCSWALIGHCLGYLPLSANQAAGEYDATNAFLHVPVCSEIVLDGVTCVTEPTRRFEVAPCVSGPELFAALPFELLFVSLFVLFFIRPLPSTLLSLALLGFFLFCSLLCSLLLPLPLLHIKARRVCP